MTHNIEVVSPVSRKISVVIPAEDVNAAISAAAKAVGAGLTIPGFRKGKVPASIIEKRFQGEVYSRASEDLVGKAVAEILDKEGLKPLSRPEFDAEPMERGKDLSFSFTFETLPDITLPEDLSALSVAMAPTEATPEDVENFTTGVLRRFAKLEEVTESRLPENGDIVTLDILEEYLLRYPGLRTEPPDPEEEAPRPAAEEIPADKEPAASAGGTAPQGSDPETLRAQLSGLSADQLRLIAAISPPSTHVDEIAERSGLPVSRVLSQLTVLEIKGYVRREPGRYFSLNI